MGETVEMGPEGTDIHSLQDTMEVAGIPQHSLVVAGKQFSTAVVTGGGGGFQSWAREMVAGELWMLLLGEE